MPSYDPSRAECFVFTFKEGLLSKVAHDLRLAVTRFDIHVDGASVTARFDTASLRVDTPMKDGVPNPSALSSADKEKIAAQICDEVLHAREFPEAVFRSTSVTPRADGGYDLSGELTLHGVTKALQAQTRARDGRQELTLTLHQPDFSITPFRAMLGTLKIQPDVTVRVVV
ncbi:MAG: YceI family protein [Polyangiaceae bacterium]|nr:YceI family protein [Polyangiaceae bacterium]